MLLLRKKRNFYIEISGALCRAKATFAPLTDFFAFVIINRSYCRKRFSLTGKGRKEIKI